MTRSRLRGYDNQLVDDCLLVVSELVTNAMRHGGGIVGFRVTTPPGRVLVSVQDRSSALPVVAQRSSSPMPGGYGWPLVRRLAKQITISLREGDGKAIHVSLTR